MRWRGRCGGWLGGSDSLGGRVVVWEGWGWVEVWVTSRASSLWSGKRGRPPAVPSRFGRVGWSFGPTAAEARRDGRRAHPARLLLLEAFLDNFGDL